MLSASPKTPRYRFGPFELDPGAGTLARDGTRVKLQDLPYRVLVILVERRGETVTREEVRQRVWPQDTFVEFDNSLGVAVRKVRDALHDDAEAPCYLETIPKRGYRFIAPVTVLQPSQQAEVAPDSTPSPTASPGEKTAKGPGWLPRYWVTAALVLLLVGGAVYAFRSGPLRPSNKAQASATPLRVRRSVAVLGFRNLPGRGEDNWLSAAFSEMLNTELAAGGSVRLISGEEVARAKRELPLADEDSLAKATLSRLRVNPGADVVVLGSYTPVGGNGDKRIRLDVRLQDTLRGETISEQAFTGSEDDLFELAEQAGSSLRESLGISSISSQATSAIRAARPSNAKAARLYAEGRVKLWAYDAFAARDLLTQAVAEDPENALMHSALSEAFWHTGYNVKARAEAERARDLSGHLSEEQHLLIEGQYERSLPNFPKAVQAYQSLFRLFPDSLDYGLLLASAQLAVNHSDSLQTLATLRALPAPNGNDPRIDMVEASAWINADLTKAREAASRAIEKARAQGSHAIVSHVYGILCQQEPSLGASREALSDCNSAMESGIAAKDLNGTAMMRSNLASIYFEMGDLKLSEKMFRTAIEEFRRVGNPDGVATALSNLAGARLTAGDLNEARKLLEQAIPQYQAVEDKEGVALNLNNLGDLSRQSGNLEAAETTYQQAKATAEEIEDKDAIGYVLHGLGDVAMDRGDLARARKSYEESLAVRTQVGEKQTACETQVGLANLAIEEGHPAEAESILRKCKDQFHSGQQSDDEIAASTVLIEALLAQDKQPDAEKEVEAESTLAARRENRMVRLEFALASARVKMRSQDPNASRAPLRQLLQDAHAHGFLGIEFELRLAIAELERRIGNLPAAQIQFTALEKNARAKGFGLIARKATAARG